MNDNNLDKDETDRFFFFFPWMEAEGMCISYDFS